MKKNGFSLIEVIVAIAILVGSMVVISTTWSSNLLRLRKAGLNSNVATLLERKATELEALYKDKPLPEIPEDLAGDFGEGYPKFRWVMKTQEFDMPDLTPMLVGREGGANEMLINMVKQMQDVIKKSVKEAKISVFAKIGEKEKEYSVTTYFVTYEIQVPGAGQ